jgi:CRISPR-associated protein Csm3
MADKTIELKGRVFFTFDIEAATGLHIGGTETGIEIGGVDKTVIRNRLDNRPYIPGSSLRGKMRSLLEKYRGLKQNQSIGTYSSIHSCGADYRDDDLKTKGRKEYLECDVCQVFGVPGERPFSTPTRLVVRDVRMTDKSADQLNATNRTDLPYTEVKTEVSIDRVTSAANPRQMERVPAGTFFGPAELVYSIYAGDDCDPRRDVERIVTVVEGMQLLEDDYLGGLGSRGSGKVRLHDIRVSVRSQDGYLAQPVEIGRFDDAQGLAAGLAEQQAGVLRALGLA